MSTDKSITLSIVVPAYNEQEVLPEFHRRLSTVLDDLGVASEVVYANDGSGDSTLALLEQLAAADPRVAIVDLSRNFGKEIALTAGMDHARGEAVVVIDADLQDPPELIPELVKYWRDGFDVVYAKRTVRDGESWVKKATAKLFYQVIRGMSRVDIPQDVGDFRLLSRRALDALGSLREQHRFMKGLFAWIGFPSKAVLYKRDPRFAGETKWNYWKLWNFALEGITSFTIAPLKIATYVGVMASLGAFVYAAWIIYRTLMYGDPARGYPSMMVVILFIGGLQLMGMGIIGEYLGRMFDETKNRPLYFLKGHTPSRPPTPESKT
jgi:glycosyltransferase involved in cell wall biosynthesis